MCYKLCVSIDENTIHHKDWQQATKPLEKEGEGKEDKEERKDEQEGEGERGGGH